MVDAGLALPPSPVLGRLIHYGSVRLDSSIFTRMISVMAQKTVVSLIDDLDGQSEADETVEYAIDGVTYEIDKDNAEALREVLAPYIAAARRTGGRARSGPGSRGRSSASSGAVANAAGRGREAMKAIRD
jgi:hypothetical protein